MYTVSGSLNIRDCEQLCVRVHVHGEIVNNYVYEYMYTVSGSLNIRDCEQLGVRVHVHGQWFTKY